MLAAGSYAACRIRGPMMTVEEVSMTTDRPRDELPEHERRPETEVGGGIAGQAGTARETGPDRRAMDAGLDDDARRPASAVVDEEPEDPDGPDVAYQPRSV